MSHMSGVVPLPPEIHGISLIVSERNLNAPYNRINLNAKNFDLILEPVISSKLKIAVS